MAARGGGFPAWDSTFDPTKHSQKPIATANAQVADQAVAVKTQVNTEPGTNGDAQAQTTETPLKDAHTTVMSKACTETKNTPSQMLTHEHSPTVETQETAAKNKPASIEPKLAEHRHTDPDETQRLVSIREISKIHAAKVGNRWMSFAQVDGWTCLVPHRAFKAGELVLYLEVDAMIPASDDRFGKMSTLQTYDGKLCHRVKTRKFGTGGEAIIVQGYICPIEKFDCVYEELEAVRWALEMTPERVITQKEMNRIIIAMYRKTNWAEKLGIKKWEETVHMQSSLDHEHPRLGKTPTRLFGKTDITRVEDCPNLFIKPKYTKRVYQESVKMDGASMTVYFVSSESRRFAELNPLPARVGPNTVLDNGRFGVCSKSVDLNELNSAGKGKDNFSYWAAALRHGLPAKLSALGKNLAVQGELCGPGINRNREGIAGDQAEFFVFGMFDIDRQKYVDPRKVVTLATQLGLRHVPVLGYMKIPEIASCHEDLKSRARERKGEGLVYKCLMDGRSFKVISSTYLLEHNI